MSSTPLWSAGLRSPAVEANTTFLPARANETRCESPLPALPLADAEARKVSPVNPLSSLPPFSTFTYTCLVPGAGLLVTALFQAPTLVVVSARLVASETKATRSQSPSTATS